MHRDARRPPRRPSRHRRGHPDALGGAALRFPAGFIPLRPIDELAALGPVWAAERHGTELALKVLSALELHEDDQLRIVEQWDRLAALRDDGLVGFVEGGFEPRPWGATELVHGATPLGRELHLGPVGLMRAVEIATQAAAALATLHAAGLIHGVLEPNDLLLVEVAAAPPLVKVANTWLGALLLPPPDPAISSVARLPQRNLPYAPPELVADREIGAPADVYALAAILDHALGGASVPPRMASLILHMRAERPEDRPVMAEVGRALLAA